MFASYRDLWKTKSEKTNAIRQGIISTDGDLTLNCMKLRINAGDKSVTVTVEGKPNQLCSQGTRSFEQYDEARKYFAEGRLANEVQAQKIMLLQKHMETSSSFLLTLKC